MVNHRWTFLITYFQHRDSRWIWYSEFRIFPYHFRGMEPAMPEQGNPVNVFWRDDESYCGGDLGVFKAQDGSSQVTFCRLGSILDHPSILSSESVGVAWKRVLASRGGFYFDAQPETPSPCLDLEVGTVHVLG